MTNRLVIQIHIFGIGQAIRYMDHLAFKRSAADQRAPPLRNGMLGRMLYESRRGIVGGGYRELVPFQLEDQDILRFAKPTSRLNDGVENGLQIKRRAADDLEDFGGRCLLLQRLAQLRGPLLDLVLQVRIGFLKSFAHVVELIGKSFQLVARRNRDALREIAAADALGTDAQGLDRPDHAPGQEY